MKYTTPEVKIVKFEAMEVIAASNGPQEPTEGEGVGGGSWA